MRKLLNLVFCGVIILLSGCITGRTESKKQDFEQTEAALNPKSETQEPAGWRGLYVRDGDQIKEASPEDVSLAQSFYHFPGKQPFVNGKRLTILVAPRVFKIGEEVRVIHFYEVSGEESELYIMGPKEVYGEFVDGKPASSPAPDFGYPWMMVYDGEVMPGPGEDYNFNITTYQFQSPGEHTIQWKIDGLESNLVTVIVK